MAEQAVHNEGPGGAAALSGPLEDPLHLVASVSHDLRQPLSVIKGYTNLLRRRLAEENNTRHEFELQQINAAANRVQAELDDLTDLTAYAGLTLDLRPADLLRLLNDLMAELGASFPGVTLTFESHVSALNGLFDAPKLRRVFWNLLSNAVKYSYEAGEITLIAERKQSVDGWWAVVAVADRGLGIPEADLLHIFERHGRAANVGDIRGLGLGLETARAFVELHGGRLEATSRLGAGSVFTVWLPLWLTRPSAH
jgi:signal transduction histidine kinase